MEIDPLSEVIPGVIWGRPEWHLSASFWAKLASSWRKSDKLFGRSESLTQEVIFCVLGGYGITAEVNVAAYDALKGEGLFLTPSAWSAAQIERVLAIPLQIGERKQKYRFPKQRSLRIVSALERLQTVPPPQDPAQLRAYLLQFDGIGPKTASWIVRNWLDSDDVAIIDVHVRRACLRLGVFFPEHCVTRHYDEMEARFIDFAHAIEVRPSHLDALMWSTMRQLPPSMVAN